MTVNAYRTVDGQRAGDVRRLDKVSVGAGRWSVLKRRGGSAGQKRSFRHRAPVRRCGSAMLYANEATLEYLKTRKQFGVSPSAPSGRCSTAWWT